MDQAGVVELVGKRLRESGRPIAVGISGFCGSGKSTLAKALVAALPDAVRIRGDDFLDPTRSHRRSSDWDGVDRQRLVATVLEPHRQRRPGAFRRFDWSTRDLGAPEPVPRAQVLIVDLIGLFHPEALPSIDVSVWCDVDLGTAAERGRARDTRLGRHHEALWRDVWVPNEQEFERRFSPREHAAALYRPILL